MGWKLRSKIIIPIRSKGDDIGLSHARMELRKNQFFHKEYDPKHEEAIQKRINDKIYQLNSFEPYYDKD